MVPGQAPGEGEVALLVPGLQGPRGVDGADPRPVLDALLLGLELPALRQLLLCAEPLAGPHGSQPEEMFFQLLGFAPGEFGGWPTAALSRLAGHDDAHDGYWLRADPVHLRPDLAKLLLLQPSSLALDLDDANRLAAHINVYRDDLCFQVQPDAATRWFVPLASPPRMWCVSPVVAHAQDAARNLPRGPDAEVWHQRMNLVQMLLHEAPVNVQREERGLMSVNSLWMWGAGALPQHCGECRELVVYSDRSWARGAARLLGGRSEALAAPDRAPGIVAAKGSQILLVEHFVESLRGGDPVAWREQLQDFDRCWLQPLLAGLAQGQVKALHLHLGGATGVRLTRTMMRRWWAPRRWWRTSLPALMCARLRSQPASAQRRP